MSDFKVTKQSDESKALEETLNNMQANIERLYEKINTLNSRVFALENKDGEER